MAFVLAAAASAATPGYGVQVTSDASSATTDESGCVDFNATVKNTGSAPAPPSHRIALSADAGDSGWTIDPTPPDTVSLAPGAEETITFGACAGGTAEDGATATITLHAVVSDDPGAEEQKAKASADFTATYSALADPQGNDTLFDDENETEDVGNETGSGDNGESPGPAVLLVVATAFALAAGARRRRR